MKLVLKNFRCYKNKEFEFNNTGLCLITAPSGSGKSTILMAINFVLYGKGKNVISFGENSCSVELIFNENLYIKRSKKPNVLMVNGEYEDEVGQQIINKMFGETFDITGYIPQNAFNSFIRMNSSDMLQFLEIAFKDVKLNEAKERVKNLISKEHDELTKLSGEISMCEKMLMDLNKPEEVSFPFKTKNEELSIKNEEIRLKNVSKRIEKTSRELSQYQKQFNDYRVLNSYVKSKKENLDKIISRIDTLKEENRSDDESYSELLTDYSRRLKNLKSRREINVLISQLEKDEKKLIEMKKKEEENLKKDLTSMTVNLWEDYSKEECLKLIDDMKEAQKDCQKIKHLEDQMNKEKVGDVEKIKETLANLLKEVEDKTQEYEMIKKSQNLKECPSCKETLIVNNDDDLVVFNERISKHSKEDEDRCYKTLLELKKKAKVKENEFSRTKSLMESIDKMKVEISSIKEGYDEELNLEEITENIEELQSYFKNQTSLERKINDIKTKLKEGRFSSSLEYLEKDVIRQRRKVEELNDESETRREGEESMTEEELQELITETKRKKEENGRIKMERKKLIDDKEMIENEIDIAETNFISKFQEIKTEEEMKMLIEKSNDELLEYEKQKKSHQDNLNVIEKYKQYRKDKESYDNWINQMENLKERESLSSKRYSSSLLLKQSILEAESIAVTNIVNNINTNASIFLEHFFPVNPIVVNIVCFKEVKNNSKPQLNVEVLYKDMMCDLSTLSGGELSRVILAFTLSLADLYQSPLLLLDETTASLDEELTTIVFETIKEHFRNIPILSISHQCTEGIFDTVLKIQ